MYCSHCGIANVAHAVYCKMCAEPIVAPAVPAPAPPTTSVPAVTLALAAQARLPLKSPLGAALLSWLWPGLGHCYAGRVGVGVALIIFGPVIYYVLLIIAAFDPPLIILLFIVAIVIACGAANSAREVNAIRNAARAAVRASRGAPSLSAPAASWNAPTRTGTVTAKPQPALIGAPVAVKYSPATLPALVFICVCAIVLIVETVSSYA